MTDDKYAWQKETPVLWSSTGFKGICCAPPRSGKTRTGANCIRFYQKYFPYNRIWVIANSKIVLEEWKGELDDVDDVEFYTYPGAVSKFQKMTREGKEKQFPDLLVLDECQYVRAREWGKVLDFGVGHLLGFSATPGVSYKKIGPIFQKVDRESANVADTTIHMISFTPTDKEKETYRKQTETINSYRADFPYATYYNDEYMKLITNRRRFSVYNMNSRIPIAVDLIKRYSDRKVMVFCMHTKQIKKISDILDKERIKYCVHYTGKEELTEFTSGNVNICLTCRKVNVGFNYPDADVGIMVSTALSAEHLIQTCYRVMSPKDGKKAEVYILLAEGTTDEDAMNVNLFSKDHIIKGRWAELEEQ